MSKMPIKVSKSAKEYTIPIAILKGLIVSYIITIPAFFIFVLILSRIDSCADLISPVVLITTIISVLAAGTVSAKALKSKGWINGALVGLCYMVVLYFLGSIIYMNFSITRYVMTMFLIGILSGAVGGILGVNSNKSYGKSIKS